MNYKKTSNGVKKIRTITSLAVIIALFVVLFGPPLRVALAAALFNKSDTMSSSKISTASNHTIVFRTPTGAGDSTDTITVTFPSGFTMNSVTFDDFDLAHSAGGQSNCTSPTYSNDETLAATPSATAWGATSSGQVITFTAPTDGVGAAAIAANACTRIKIGTNATTGVTGDTQITDPSSATSYDIAIAGAFGDTGDIRVTILSDDQVAVSATVEESLTFTLGTTSVALGTLSTSAVTSGSHTVTLATNAASGLVLTYAGNTLTFGSSTITAMSTATTSQVGTEQFGINAKDNATPDVGVECSGTAPIAAAATGYATVNQFKFVTDETVISAANAINSTSCTISYITNIAALTEAGSYATALTYTATATF
ncbi:MAG: hypothetical protein HYS57_01960 [Parcubacteria group bacterium]|nr:hypothetical protein [Parcubacteria group bacterium]